jgi:dipeptidyl aminopeptidase/acylaminoacyl peptidase
MKSLSGKLGVILIGLIIFGHAEMSGADKTVYSSTGAGYIFHPKLSNGRALVYCHGGFGKVRNPDLPDVDYFVNHGWTVLVLKYEEETGKRMSIQGDIQEIMEVTLSLKEKFGSVDLLGVSRGGFVAMQTFIRHGEKFGKCVAVVAPTHVESLEVIREMTREQQQYIKELDDPDEYVGKMPLVERLALGKKLLLIYGSKDDVVPASQGAKFSEETKCKRILVDGSHMLFSRQEHERLAEEFLLNRIKEFNVTH